MEIPKQHYDRFMSRILVNQQTGCWDWTSYKSKGYAQFSIGKTKHSGHRLSYEWHVGPIPEGLVIDHLCRNRGCVNPEHLEPVTNAENLLRGEGLGVQNARKTHCKHGHPYAGDNLYIRPKTGHRDCRTCIRQRDLNKAAGKR